MPGIYGFPEGQIIAMALVFLRLIAFVVAWPVFGSASVPVSVKVLLALILAITLTPTLRFQNADMIGFREELIFISVRELLIGLSLGFLMRMFFFAVSVSGEIISVSIGLASAQLYNPAMGATSNVVEQFQLMLATLFFLALNGHHVFLTGVAQSFEMVPVASMGFNVEAFSNVAAAAQDVMLMGLKMAAPILIAIFLANVAMGVIGRAVPQINVLVTSMPVTTLIGLGVLFIGMPLFIVEMDGLMVVMADRLFQFMKVL